ncbi:MAG: hypothetical protein LBI89_04295 [Prevotellaceae bacterium]|jgi:hypothetical protein|nr:hypothetical protein [Prevotellaceae bacterium]
MIHVPCFPALELHSLRDVPAEALKPLPSYPVACANWKEYPYAPFVTVKMACTRTHMLLYYEVRENSIRARHALPNEPVYTDSCVEFFVSPDDRQTYYNFEFNCIGTPLLRHNIKPHEGPRATPALLATILTESSLGSRPFERMDGDFTWQLAVAIPFTCFFAHPPRSRRGQTLFANCYKCGDRLTTPHYLSLFPIRTPAPDFHVPESFRPLLLL